MSDDPFVQLSMSDRVVRPCLPSGGPRGDRIGSDEANDGVTAPGREGSRDASPRPGPVDCLVCADLVRRAVANPEPTD